MFRLNKLKPRCGTERVRCRISENGADYRADSIFVCVSSVFLKLLSVFTAGVMTFSFISPVYAAAASAVDSIFISSAEEMISFAEKCTLDSWSKGKTATLTDDIDLTGTDFKPVPIFLGTFDGAGHTVRGVRITETGSAQGLFRYLEQGASIKNLNVVGNIIPTGSASSVGGIVGVNSGSIRDCTFLGSVRGESSVGGIAGSNKESGTVIGCSSSGFIYGKSATGGIVGYNTGLLLKCDNSAGINLTNPESSLSFSDIAAEGILDSYLYSDSDNGEYDILDNCTDSGGIVGYSGGIVQSCVNSGDVGYPHVGYNMGGVAGRQSGYLAGCSNKGTVNGRKDVGGIVGQAEPYLTLEPGRETLEKIRTELHTLNDLIDKTLNDVQDTGDDVSQRLSTMKEYTETAERSCKEMLDDMTGFVDDNVEIINTLSADITNALDKIAPAMDKLSESGAYLSEAFDQLGSAADDLKNVVDASDSAMENVRSSLEKMKSASDGLSDASADFKTAVEVLTDYVVSDLAQLLDTAFDDIQKTAEEMNRALRELKRAADELIEALYDWGISDILPTGGNYEAVNSFSDQLAPPYADNVGESQTLMTASEAANPSVSAPDTQELPINTDNSDITEPVVGTVAPTDGETADNPIDPGNTGASDDTTATEDVENPDEPTEPGDTENPDNPTDPGDGENPDNNRPSVPNIPEMPEAPEITISTGDYERIIRTLQYDWDIVSDALGKSADSLNTASESLGKALEELETAADKLDPVSEDINNALDKLDAAADAASSIGKALESAFDSFEDAVKGLTDEGPKEFRVLGDGFRASGNTLHGSVISIIDDAEELNRQLDRNGGVVADDLRAINERLEIISDLVVNAVSDLRDDVYYPSVGETLEDTSDEDVADTRQGKVTDCVNRGEVTGDRNVGGIVGALAIEFDLDPEGDLTEDVRFGATYETKAVIQTGRNYGAVTAKKDCVGGVVGQMELGTAIYCQNYGEVISSGGNYVGGIAGYADAVVRSCYAKSVLSGGNYIGGITGWSRNLRNSYAIVTVKEGGEYIGAVSGSVQTDGVLTGNRFIDTGTAGVDGISYADRAEPIEFSELTKLDGIPGEFTEFNMILTANEKLVEKIPFDYGEDLSKIKLPDVPELYGSFGRWGEFDTSGVMSDVTLEAVYSPWRTNVASVETEGKLPVALADGRFTDEAVLHARTENTDTEEETISISLTGTELGAGDVIPVRLLNTSGKSAEVRQFINGSWQKVNAKESGSYLLFEMTGTEGSFMLQPKQGGLTIIIIAAAAALALVLIIVITAKRRKKKVTAKIKGNNNSNSGKGKKK